MRLLPLVAVVICIPAAPVRAADVILGAESKAQWDSNLFNTTRPYDDDFSFLLGPSIRLSEAQGDLTYDVFYRPEYRFYTRFTDLDDWEHFLNATGSWRYQENTTFTLNEQFQDQPIAQLSFDRPTSQGGAPIGGENFLATPGNDRVRVNTASFSIDHQFSPRWKGLLQLSDENLWPTQEDQAQVMTLTGLAQTTYAFTETDDLGAGISVTYQDFGATDVQDAQTTQYYNLFGVWIHQFSPTWTLNVRAGPALVDSADLEAATSVSGVPRFVGLNGGLLDTAGCRPLSDGTLVLDRCNENAVLPPVSGAIPPSATFPNGGILIVASPTTADLQQVVTVPVQGDQLKSDLTITYLAAISMVKRWETVTGTLSYTRNASSTSGFGTSSIVDTIQGQLDWRATERWTVRFTALWDNRESTSDGLEYRQVLGTFPYGSTVVDPLTLNPYPGSTVFADVAVNSALLAEKSNNAINVSRYLVGLNSDYRLTKRLTLFGRAYYQQQQGKNDTNDGSSDYGDTQVELGFRYTFDPIQL